jgi:MFS transporter, Spinster family, sphingosine-1-phosphate transporter
VIRMPARNTYSMVLICIAMAFDYLDRSLLAVLLEPIRHEFSLTDTQLGMLSGIAFGLSYSVLGILMSRWADVGNRRALLGWALLFWSLMTSLCGAVQNYSQLFLARVGVGVGEACGAPTSHSLATDYFPPARHGQAASYLASASMVGSIIGLIAGGAIAAAAGWRMAFFAGGVPGLLIAVLMLKTLAEPRTHARVPALAEVFGRESVELMKYLLRKRTFILIALAFSSISLLSLGLQQWGPSFMVRSFHIGLARVGLIYGSVVSGSLLLGAMLGGPLTVRARTHGVAWLAYVPAICCLLAVPSYALAFTSQGLALFIVGSVCGGLLLGAATPPVYACIYGIAGASRRAVAMALVLLIFNLLGLGLGPLLIGLLSDALRSLAGTESLRYSLLAVVAILPLTSYLFYASARTVTQDFEPEANN